MPKIKLLLMLALILIGSADMALSNSQSEAEPYPAVTIPDTEQIQFPSTITGREYKILVSLPDEYSDSAPDTRFGVVYVLDADLIYATVTEFTRLGVISQELAVPLIVVGIGYNDRPLAWRGVDMNDDADNFVRFIGEELIPFIDDRYRTLTDPVDRTIIGHSLGGQFALYSLFHSPTLFTGYLATSPVTLPIFNAETAYFAEHTELPVKLFMSAAEGEALHVEALFDQIQSRNYEGLEATYQEFEDLPHALSFYPALTYGLRIIYAQ